MFAKKKQKTNTFKKQEPRKKKGRKLPRFSIPFPGRLLAPLGFLSKRTSLSVELLQKQIPFVAYLVLLAVISISVSHITDRQERELRKVNKEIKELDFQFTTTRSRLDSLSIPSEVARRVEHIGVKQSEVPPRKIFGQ